MKRTLVLALPLLLVFGSLSLAWRGMWIAPSLEPWSRTTKVGDPSTWIVCPSGGTYDSLSTPFASVYLRGWGSPSGRFSWKAEEGLRDEMTFVSHLHEGISARMRTSQEVDLRAPHLASEFALLDSRTFYVAGPPLNLDFEDYQENPVTRVTRWSLIQPEGTPAFRRARRSVQIGISAETSAMHLDLVGEDYVAAEERDEPRITHHFLAELPFHCDGLEVDPEGRYLVALDGTEGKLYRLDLLDPEHPTHLISESIELVGSSWLRMHLDASEDSKCIAVSGAGGELLLWYDHENTGEFDDHRVLAPVPGDSCGELTSIDWSDTYCEYLMTFRTWTEVLGY